MKKIKYIVSTILLGYIFTACNDNLEITPPSSIIPEDYLAEESQLDSYVINLYPNLPNASGGLGLDNATDDEAGMTYSNLYTEGDYRVGETGGDWNFEDIYQVNYFLERVLPLYQSGEIQGTK